MAKLQSLWWAVILIVFIAACNGDDEAQDPAPAKPTDVPSVISWRPPNQIFSAETVPQIEMTGRLGGHTTTVIALNFSTDSTKLVSLSSADERINFWDMTSGELVQRLDDTGTRWAYWKQGNNQIVTLGTDNVVREWVVSAEDVSPTDATGIPIQVDVISVVMLSPNADRLVIGGDTGSLQLIALNPLTAQGLIQGTHTDQVDVIAFLPDNNRFISMNRRNAEVNVWNFESSQFLHQFALDESVYQMTVSPDGQFLALSYVNKIQVWKLDDYTLVNEWFVPSDTARDVLRFLPNNLFLVSAGVDAIIGIWDVRTGNLASGGDVDVPADQFPVIKDLMVTPSGDLLIAQAQMPSLYFWDLRPLSDYDPEGVDPVILPSSIYTPITEDIYAFSLSPDGRVLVITDIYGELYAFTLQE
jgi:WD40 repeat protein